MFGGLFYLTVAGCVFVLATPARAVGDGKYHRQDENGVEPYPGYTEQENMREEQCRSMLSVYQKNFEMKTILLEHLHHLQCSHHSPAAVYIGMVGTGGHDSSGYTLVENMRTSQCQFKMSLYNDILEFNMKIKDNYTILQCTSPKLDSAFQTPQ